MKAKNKVIAGDYLRCNVWIEFGQLCISKGLKSINLDSNTVQSYTLVTEDIRKSAVSGIVRGAIGSAFLGKAGLLAGVSAKNIGIYLVAIQFKDGKNSLLELDQKLYKKLVMALISITNNKTKENSFDNNVQKVVETKEQQEEILLHSIDIPQYTKVIPKVDKVEIFKQIKRLGELRDKGILNEIEFEEKKKILLEKI